MQTTCTQTPAVLVLHPTSCVNRQTWNPAPALAQPALLQASCLNSAPSPHCPYGCSAKETRRLGNETCTSLQTALPQALTAVLCLSEGRCTNDTNYLLHWLLSSHYYFPKETFPYQINIIFPYATTAPSLLSLGRALELWSSPPDHTCATGRVQPGLVSLAAPYPVQHRSS